MSARTILEMFEERVASSGDAVALRVRREGRWESWTWNEWFDAVDRYARGLVGMGVERGDRVAVIARNRPEWVVADLAIMQIGAVSVPIVPGCLSKHCSWTLQHAQVRWAIVEDPHQLGKLASVRDELPGIERVVVMDTVALLDEPDQQGRITLTLEQLGAETALDRGWVVDDDQLGEIAAQVARTDPMAGQRRRIDSQLEDLATIVYTAGTSGLPRGVMISHGNLAAEVLGNALALPVGPGDHQILVLPLSQVFARILYLTAMHVGAVTSFSRGLTHLMREFREENPTYFVGVPAVFEWMAGRFATRRGGRKILSHDRVRTLAGVAARKCRADQGRHELSLQDRLLWQVGQSTLYREVRAMFGERLRFAISGGARLSPRIAEIFHGAGVPIHEGYGLTETCGAATVNRPDAWRTGSVGLPLRDVEVRIADDGEVLIRGPVVAMGYWQDPEATAEVFRDGWLHTGDIGGFVGQFLEIIDRKSDLIQLSSGRRVSPVRVESALQALSLVRRAIVAGEGDSNLSALLTLDADPLLAWAASNELAHLSFEELCSHELVYDAVRQGVERVNSELKPSERVRRFAILPRAFSPETGELTSTYKVRRRFVLEKYRGVLAGLRDT